ncbi:hypothetical protein ASPZODRAFT_126671 [Penicilliopsis zonata CBS 506.65]|uniref:beta-glucosidase n=1 Tax=Penicilliopsis zonata CBS 506.65 TaxID=1073090 RepID=A0A1L9SU46_9EURO|nr:hypothetical protein ASPZODRAFT_126671 [Penicilliopsis zonata CBS 506.65]OJJ50745.1 hypothetical protein ASPZODRAFT_126671 [Penicilliopsis zonata CBS 506.65]
MTGCQSVGIAATPKHFVANDAENLRTTLSTEVDEQTLRELYLLPFQLIMKLADPWCFMTSYNRVNGTYVSDDPRLVQGVLRHEWGFRGLVVSDWMGTYSTAEGMNAGVDLEMPGPPKWRGERLLQAVAEGAVSQKTIDESARRVLDLARRLRRWEEHPEEEPPERALEDPERDEFIRDAAAEGIVLLQNRDAVLPLTLAAGETVALIGHHARIVTLGGGGSARVDALHAVNLVDGFAQLGVQTTVSPGVPVFGAVPHADAGLLFQTGGGQGEQPVKVEWFNGSVVGENLVHTETRPVPEYMIKEQWPAYLAREYCTRMTVDLQPESSGEHLFSVVSTGRAVCSINGRVVFERAQETALKPESFYFFKSKLERRFTFAMQAGVRYTLTLESWATDPEILAAKPLFGRMFQGSALRFHEAIDVPGAIEAAASTARACAAAVVCVGTTNEIESEGFDRDTMDLTDEQYALIRAVAAQNPRTVVVNFSGAPVGLTQVLDVVPAVVQAWFPGQECGHAVARVLTGAVNPSGRLPLSWPRQVEDNPSFGNFPADEETLLIKYEEGLDVGYRFYDREETPTPLFPFGFGLSYTSFAVSNARVVASVQQQQAVLSSRSDTVEVKCDVQNTGSRTGKVVVQFYVGMPATTIGRKRPIKELKEFVKVELAAGQSQTISVVLDRYAVSLYDADRSCWRANPGRYTVYVGQSSVDLSSQTDFTVSEPLEWTGI